MSYLFNTSDDLRAMLEAIGVESLADLFRSIPDAMQLHRPLAIPPALSELELTQHMSGLAAQNTHAGRQVCFLGGGSYDHFVPAVVDALASRSEFYTSYTPYQPEVSQGNLQAMFEYQTLICQLTGMDVSNASLYDGGSAAVEAVLMSLSVTGRSGKVVAAAGVHPEYRQILQTYLANLGTELVTIGAGQGGAGQGGSVRWTVPASATTFSSSIRLPMSFAPKSRASWPIFRPCVTQLAWMLAKLSRNSRATAWVLR